MATTQCVNRHPPSRSGSNRGNPNPQANTVTGAPNCGQQNPGPHTTGQDPGPSAHPQIPHQPRPFFYVHAAPPPPFFYQWPVPFPYNPFAGFPGMGFSMVMPPTPYMEAPGYILPHPHLQPVDYRRLLHPQVPAASAPYQSQNQTRRFRPQHSVSVVRQTVNSGVQTEPALTRTTAGYGEGSPLASSESGHGTGTNPTSPSSSSSTTEKRGYTKVGNYTLPSSNAKEDLQVSRTSPVISTAKHCFETQPTRPETVQSLIRAPLEAQKRHKVSIGQENGAPGSQGGLGHCDMWSVCSTDSMVPICSSSDREDDVAKERRVSFPDILSWGCGTPPVAMLKMADKVLPQSEDLLTSYEETEAEPEKVVNHSSTERSKVADDGNDAEDVFSSKESEALYKILKLPFALKELLLESRKQNESVDLVGSIRPCIPSRERVAKHELLASVNKKVSDNDPQQGNVTDSIVEEDTTDITPHQMSFSYVQIKRKMNDSVWSVESLAPYIPSKEWLMQNGILEPDVIIEEITEEGQNNVIVKANNKEGRQCRRFSLSSVEPLPVYVPSASWFVDQCKVYCHNRFPLTSLQSTPAEKLRPQKSLEMEREIDSPKMEGQLKSSEKDTPASTTHLQSKVISFHPSVEQKGVDENGSSEPEANQSPNQEYVIKQQEKSPCSPEQVESCLSNSVVGEENQVIGQLSRHNKVEMEQEEASLLRSEQLGVKMTDQKMAVVSSSKGHFVDCGVQCSKLREWNCFCKGFKSNTGANRKNPFKLSDSKKAAKAAEETCENGHVQKNPKRHGQWKNRLQDRQLTPNPSNKPFTPYTSQEESCNGYYAKPGKTKGGNGRNPRY